MKLKITALFASLLMLLVCCIGCQASGGKKSMNAKAFSEKYKIARTADTCKVIIDGDIMYLNDDMYAVFAALQADKLGMIDLLGITATSGNTFVSGAVYDALNQLEYVGRTDIPVFAGVDEPLNGWVDVERSKAETGDIGWYGCYTYMDSYTADYMKAKVNGISISPLPDPVTKPQEMSSVDFIIEQIHKYPGQVTLIALGGMQNIALALQKDPTIASEAAEIIYMGGVFDVCGQSLENVEYNFWFDPTATNICLRADWKSQVIVSHDAATTCLKGKAVYQRFKDKNTTKITELIVNDLAPIYENGKVEDLLYCWDPLTMAYLLCPEICTDVQTRYVYVDEQYGVNYGATMNWKEGTQPENMPQCRVVLAADNERFWDFISDIYSVS